MVNSKLLSSITMTVVAVLLFCTIAAIVSPSVRADNGWQGAAVTGTYGSAQKLCPSVTYTSTGEPRVAYYDLTNGDLLCLARAGGTWYAKHVDSVGDVGSYCALALDKNNLPRISYYDYTNGDLKYAWADANWVWHIEKADTAGRVGMFTSIVIAPDGQPRISYCDWTNGNLKYAYRTTSGTWVTTTVDSAGVVGWYTSIAINPKNGYPAISYYDYTNGNLKYAWKDPTTIKWVTETADASKNDVGGWSKLAFTSAGDPRISYSDYTNSDLKYAAKAGSTWYYKTFPTAAAQDGVCPSLVISKNGWPRISSIDQTNNRLLFTWETQGYVWHTEVVISGTSTYGFAYPSIAIDRQTGKTGISYVAWSSSGMYTVNLMEKTAVWN